MMKSSLYVQLLLGFACIYCLANSKNVSPDDGECVIPDDITPPNPGPPPCDGELTNVALNKPASQSTISTAHHSPASKAVDGDRNQDFNHGSCSHTAENKEQSADDIYPWLVVDLGSKHVVKNITLYSRNNPCCPDRYHDLQFRVGDEREYGLGNVFVRNGLCSEIVGGGFPMGQIFNVECQPCLIGRYVSVQITRNCTDCYNTLSICELEVLGFPAPETQL